MNVYFVRHGQSIFNKKPRHQYPDTPLSEEGILQANLLGKRFKNITLDAIITSPFSRAKNTAQEIEKASNVSFIESELLIERKMPSAFLGKFVDDPEIAGIHEEMRQNMSNLDWRHSDEENFSDLIKRGRDTLDFIISQNNNSMAVITHGHFLQILTYIMIFDDQISPEAFVKFQHNIEFSNTGITLCEYKDNKWKVLTLNDYAHLGETD